MYMYTRKEPTYESGTTQAWGRTPLQVNTNSFSFILHRCQRLSVSSFPNSLCVLLFCDDDSFSSCSIAVSVFFVASLFHCSLLLSFFLFMHNRCQCPFLSLSFPLLLASFLFLLPFASCIWIGGGWCGWGDYSSDQYCRAVGSSVIKMASVDGPSFPHLTQEWSEYPWLAIESYVWLRLPALTQVCEPHFDCLTSVW